MSNTYRNEYLTGTNGELKYGALEKIITFMDWDEFSEDYDVGCEDFTGAWCEGFIPMEKVEKLIGKINSFDFDRLENDMPYALSQTELIEDIGYNEARQHIPNYLESVEFGYVINVGSKGISLVIEIRDYKLSDEYIRCGMNKLEN